MYALHAATCALLLLPGAALAQFDGDAYVATHYQRDSNVFALSGAEAEDSIWMGKAGLELGYAFGLQRVSAEGEVRSYRYDRFTDLDRDDYSWTLGYDGQLGTSWSGHFEARQERRLASFAFRDTTEPASERERTVRARLSLQPAEVWRVDFDVGKYHLRSPLPELPEFAIDERSAGIGLHYLGTGPATAGLVGEYTDGEFEGIGAGEPYDQWRVELATEYAISGLSQLSGRAGYTQREDQRGGGGDVSVPTGSLTLTRIISVITQVHAGAFRRVNSFVGGADALVETGARGGIVWQPGIFEVSAGLEYAKQEFQGTPAFGQGRQDRVRAGYLHVTYAPSSWLRIEPFVEYRERDSNLATENYQGSTVGIEIGLYYDRTPGQAAQE